MVKLVESLLDHRDEVLRAELQVLKQTWEVRRFVELHCVFSNTQG